MGHADRLDAVARHPRRGADESPEGRRGGSGISLYANGQLLTSVTDGTYRGARIGISAGAFSANYDGGFDNFAVYTGSCINPAQPLEAASPGGESRSVHRRVWFRPEVAARRARAF